MEQDSWVVDLSNLFINEENERGIFGARIYQNTSSLLKKISRCQIGEFVNVIILAYLIRGLTVEIGFLLNIQGAEREIKVVSLKENSTKVYNTVFAVYNADNSKSQGN